MSEPRSAKARPRSAAARLGCVALNLLQPGLGLLRIGDGRRGLLLVLLPILWLAGSIALFAAAPRPRFAAVIAYAAVAVTFTLLLYLTSAGLTWRGSRLAESYPRWWSRWYALLGVAMGTGLALDMLVPVAHRFYKPFYLPSESMAPTLGRRDRIVADMRPLRRVKAGDIVLVAMGDTVYVKRVAALPGDRVAIRDSVPVVNGVAADLRRAAAIGFLTADGQSIGALAEERFPRERIPHRVLLAPAGPFGNMAERLVPSGHVFLLGDNRGLSADSRVPRELGGLDMVPLGDLVGRPLYVTWSASSGLSGRRADR